MNIFYALILMVAIPLAAEDGTGSISQARQDHQYMVGLVEQKGHGPVSIDFSDPAQYRFVMLRLAKAGKTVDNSPYLFQCINEQKAHIRANASRPVQTTQASWDPNFSTVDHYPLYLVAEDAQNFEATAFTTAHGGTDYTFIDVMTWDEDWQQAGSYGWREEYAAGTEVIAASHGPFPEGLQSLLYIDSLQIYQFRDGVEEVVKTTYTVELGTPLPEIDLSEPRRDGGQAGHILVCLNRAHSDCDYISQGDSVMRLPFSGSYKLINAINFVAFVPGSTLKLCGLDGGTDGGTAKFIQAIPGTPLESFFEHRLEGLDEFIDWGITATDGDFGNVIFDHYAVVNWFLAIKMLAVRDAPDSRVFELTADINSHMLPDQVVITGEPLLPLQFFYSCLASGTKILLPDGSSQSVEDVEKGQPVRAGNGILTVQDTSVGTEHLPMIRIRDERGRTLLLTESHPLIDSEGKVRLASEMKVGQMLSTIEGTTRLVAVEEEQYPGHVFNLKLGTPQELASMPPHSNTMYANDYLVGDLEMQKQQQLKNEKAPLLTRLPKAWHQDYYSSQKRTQIRGG